MSTTTYRVRAEIAGHSQQIGTHFHSFRDAMETVEFLIERGIYPCVFADRPGEMAYMAHLVFNSSPELGRWWPRFTREMVTR
jgi:hypothetical protein